MEKVELIVLTKSSKFSGYCVAGIERKSGKWIRLVTENVTSYGAVEEKNLIYEDGGCCKILDIIEAPVISGMEDVLQPENVLLVVSEYIRFLGRATMEDVLKVHPVEMKNFIFGNQYQYVTEQKVEEIRYSLTLVEVHDLYIKQVINPEGKCKTKADFIYQGYKYENMSVTDYRFYSIEEMLYAGAYIVVSIGTPYNGRYYKFISAIYL